jgi:hypothetical protein
MLTKVHALAANDGLPIYDSRVAVAVATLVQVWLSCRRRALRRIPPSLRFPSADPARDVAALFVGAFSHGSVTARTAAASRAWTRTKIRLGWIIAEVLLRAPTLLLDPPLARAPIASPRPVGGTDWPSADRMHAFEAALFMMGYDARCLRRNFCNPPEGGICLPGPIRRRNSRRLARRHVGADRMICRTLVKGNEFYYSGTPDAGLRIRVARTQAIELNPEFIDDLVATFREAGWIPAGFNRGPEGHDREADKSFGYFIEQHSEAAVGRQLTRQHGARIAAVMVCEGLCQNRVRGRLLELNFA